MIGGAPLSGKTTLADMLAAKHQAVQISTDNIREWMWRLTRPEDYPSLFDGHELDVETFYRENDTPEKVMNGQINEGKDVEKGIRAFISCELPWERLIIEGIGITPEFASRLQKDFPNITFETTFLFDDNTERIRQRIQQRGLWGPKDSYPDYIKDKEVAWVILYNNFYKTEARKHNFSLRHIDSLQA